MVTTSEATQEQCPYCGQTIEFPPGINDERESAIRWGHANVCDPPEGSGTVTRSEKRRYPVFEARLAERQVRKGG